MVEIAKRNNVSERTIYRYKEYKRSSGIYADVLSSLQLMQDYGVNLICVEDGIDSSKEAGKLLYIYYCGRSRDGEGKYQSTDNGWA